MTDPVGRLLRVADARGTLNQDFYNAQYRTASQIHILGIACRGFCRSLRVLTSRGEYPGVLDTGQRGDPEATNLLGQALTRGLKIQVLLVNPLSDYAETRIKEENNADLVKHLWQSIRMIRNCADDLRRNPMAIRGSVEIRLIDRSPYITLFRSVHDDGHSDQAYLGFLLQGMRGDQSPMFHGRAQSDLGEVFNGVGNHFFILWSHSKRLFEWNRDGVASGHAYDAVCSYPSASRDRVKIFDRAVRDQLPGHLWLDYRPSHTVDMWYTDFIQTAKQVKRAIVVVDSDLGSPQIVEMDQVRDVRNEIRVCVLPFVGFESRPINWGAHTEDLWQWLKNLRPRLSFDPETGVLTPAMCNVLQQWLSE